MDDWRLQGQDKYLKGKVVERKKYQCYRDGWDHDHCEFCGTKFSLDISDALKVGYATKNNYYWICDACFEDFKALFEWKVET